VTEASPDGWAGRVAVVTGGSRGIGRAVATRFAERGARVLLTSRKPEAVAAAAESLAGDVVGVAGQQH
jgi:NAD(P)-dependent dehydrogenase (short-subunit alcohol dehydrogenase family)